MSSVSEEEVAMYKKVMELLIHGDPVRKATVDKMTSYAIKNFRDILPNATDEELAKVMMSISYTMARIQRLPFAMAGDFIQGVFEGCTAGVAILIGAYEPDPANIPDFAFPEPDPAKDAEADKLTGQYL